MYLKLQETDYFLENRISVISYSFFSITHNLNRDMYEYAMYIGEYLFSSKSCARTEVIHTYIYAVFYTVSRIIA